MAWRRFSRWAPNVPVAQRRRAAENEAKKLAKRGQTLAPINIPGRQIATTFWGKSWCANLERYSDYSNRLPRGRTYARNGSVVDLQITAGEISALVSGSSLYRISIKIDPMESKRWKAICKDCSSSIHSVIDLMRGKLSDEVIAKLTDAKNGLFPEPKQIKLGCSCPDGAWLCKHLAAVLYGVGHRLDTQPELLFLLRKVDQADLVAESLSSSNANDSMGLNQESEFASADLENLFGIELATVTPTPASPGSPKKRKATKPKVAQKKSTAKKSTTTKAAKKTKTAKKAVPKKKAASKTSKVKKATTKKQPEAPPKKLSVAAEISKRFKKAKTASP